MLRVGVIGVGIMGSGHVRTLHRDVPRVSVTAIADADGDRAAALADEVGARVLSAEALIANVDAVVIAAPDQFHAPLALACIRAGRPVLVEKPLATTPDEARAVVLAERSTGRALVSVGLMRRFDPAHVAVSDAVKSGRLGRAVLFRGIHRNQWRPEVPTATQTILASGVHDIDTARWMVGEYTQVSAHGVDSRGDGQIDVVHVVGRHASGAMSSLEVNVAAGFGYEVAAEVVGTDGTVSTIDPDRAVLRLGNRRATDVPTNWMPRFDDAYRRQLQAWVACLVSGAPYPGATAFDGLVDQEVAHAAVRALEEGTTIDVPTPM